MSEDNITLPDDGTGKKLRTRTITQSGGAHHMEVMMLADESGNLITTTTPLPIKLGTGLTIDIASGVFIASGIGVVSTPSGGGQVSGAVVVSGSVKVSGENIVITSGNVLSRISGENVVITSGDVRARISGDKVTVDGTRVSGTVQVSGLVGIQSGEVHIMSGQLVAKISGENVSVNGVQVSGTVAVSGVVSVSGNHIVAKNSGETIEVYTPVQLKTGALHKNITAASGGTVLHSGAVKAVTVKAMGDNSGIVYVGGSGFYPYSGFGFALEAGEGHTFEVNNFDAVYIVSTVSGFDDVTFAGIN